MHHERPEVILGRGEKLRNAISCASPGCHHLLINFLHLLQGDGSQASLCPRPGSKPLSSLPTAQPLHPNQTSNSHLQPCVSPPQKLLPRLLCHWGHTGKQDRICSPPCWTRSFPYTIYPPYLPATLAGALSTQLLKPDSRSFPFSLLAKQKPSSILGFLNTPLHTPPSTPGATPTLIPLECPT